MASFCLRQHYAHKSIRQLLRRHLMDAFRISIDLLAPVDTRYLPLRSTPPFSGLATERPLPRTRNGHVEIGFCGGVARYATNVIDSCVAWRSCGFHAFV